MDIQEKIFTVLSSIDIVKRIKDYPCLQETYICGGCVRNIIEDKPIGKDIDVFINRNEMQFEAFLEYIKEFGELRYGQYGSPRLFVYGHENLYLDIVPFNNFIVSENRITSIDELLSNFDITANAIGIDVKTWTMHNPVGGIEDIKNKILRAVRLDFPEKQVSATLNLSALSVFWFRLLHYKTVLGFEYDRETFEWVIKNKHRYKDLDTFQKEFFVPSISPEMEALLYME